MQQWFNWACQKYFGFTYIFISSFIILYNIFLSYPLPFLPLNSLIYSFYLPSPFQLCALPFHIANCQMWSDHILSGHEISHWSVFHLPEDTLLKRLFFPSPEGLIVFQEWGLENASLLHVRMLSGLIFCRYPQLLWGHEYSNPVMYSRYRFAPVIPYTYLLDCF